MKKWWKTVFFVLCLFGMSVFGLAAQTECASLRVQVNYGADPVADMDLFLYKVAQLDAQGAWKAETAFADFEEELQNGQDSSWQSLAQTMEAFVLREQTEPVQEVMRTGKEGSVKWQSLSDGLYLVRADRVQQETAVYTAAPFLVVLCADQNEAGADQADVTAYAKTEQQPLQADYTVIKYWKDSCHESQRPVQIRITLLCDGTVYDTVSLPQNGRWEYTWKQLETTHVWTVEEEAVQGYAAPQITQKGNVFSITNTCSKTTASEEADLPQTGQLWWPVPVLLAAGVFLILLGLLRHGESAYEA